MRRLTVKLMSLCALMVVIVCAIHVVKVWSIRDDVERAFTISPEKDILFIGSSQMGCSIDDSPRFHNYKSWISDTIVQDFLMRLKEFERRGQLAHVKICAVPFHVFLIGSQREKSFKWAWYQELPISWRYLDMLPCSRVEFGCYMASNLRFPLLLRAQDQPPVRKALDTRPELDRAVFFKAREGWASGLHKVQGSLPNWEEGLMDAYCGMKRICDRHRIRFVVYRSPVLPWFDHLIPASGHADIRKFEKRFGDVGIEYIDALHEIPECYFFDEVHLVGEGAKMFTEDLYRRMRIDE